MNSFLFKWPSWSWSNGSWIYNYLCNQCLSLLKLWVRILLMVRCTHYNIMWSSLSVTWDRLVVLSWYSGFLHQENWLPRNNWNIFESGIKHHKTNLNFEKVRNCFQSYFIHWEPLEIVVYDLITERSREIESSKRRKYGGNISSETCRGRTCSGSRLF